MVNYTTSDDGTVSADKTFVEIIAALNAGQIVEAHNTGNGVTEIYRVNMWMESVVSFLYMAFDPEMQDDTASFAQGAI